MTKEEIQSALEKNPELKKDVVALVETEAIEHIKTKQGMVVRTTEEETTFLKNYEQQKIDPRVNEIYSQLDKDILASTGVAKQGTEKTYDYLKRVIAPMTNEIKDLRKQIADGLNKDGDVLTKQQLATLKEKLEEKESEISKLTTSKTLEIAALKLQSQINEALVGKKIAVPASVPDDKKAAYVKAKRDFINAQFKSTYEVEEQDGKQVFKKDGKIMLDPKTAAPFTAEQLIENDFQFEFEEEKKPAGGAGGSGGAGGGSAEEAEVTDKASLYSYLAKKGLVTGSTDWVKEAERIAKDKKITL